MKSSKPISRRSRNTNYFSVQLLSFDSYVAESWIVHITLRDNHYQYSKMSIFGISIISFIPHKLLKVFGLCIIFFSIIWNPHYLLLSSSYIWRHSLLVQLRNMMKIVCRDQGFFSIAYKIQHSLKDNEWLHSLASNICKAGWTNLQMTHKFAQWCTDSSQSPFIME